MRQLDAIAMRNHARMLAAAYERLVAESPRKDGREGAEVFPVAGLVLAALSIEVSMKAIIARGFGLTTVKELTAHVGGGMAGHDLEHLYGRLPKTSRTHIRQTLERTQVKEHRHLFLTTPESESEMWAMLREVRKPQTFPAAMRALGKPFVSWRYGYEQSLLSCDTTFLEALMHATLGALARAIRDGARFRGIGTKTT